MNQLKSMEYNNSYRFGEEAVQEGAVKVLEELGIIPYSLIFTYKIEGGCLSITLFMKEALDLLLKKLQYYEQCDKSGFNIFPESNTVILTGMALSNFYLL